MSSAPGIAVIAGTATFGNEWLQTNKPNWKVIPATLLAAWGFTALDKLSPKASVGLASMVLIVALTTKFGGKSAFQELNSALNTTGKAVK
jgi:hypothetical protein